MIKTQNKNKWLSLFEEQLSNVKNMQKKPRLLLHGCCAPCSSYVIEYLDKYFDITLYFYNPNINTKEEYLKRLNELIRLTNEMPLSQKIEVIDGEFDNGKFEELAKGRENLPERGERCRLCYGLRLEKTAEYAFLNGFDFFTTTLSISPHKSADMINEIGSSLEKDGTKWLFSDFKKNEGYKRSIELSALYNLYRQNYCGCEYSKRQ